MFSRQVLSKAAGVVNAVTTRRMGGHAPAHFKTDAELAKISRTTLNHYPIPSGSWKANFDINQAKYNKQLIFGLSMFAATMLMVVQLKVFNFHLRPNYKSLDIHPEIPLPDDE